MKTGTNFANQQHCPPGDGAAVPQHKSIAMGSTAPKSARKTVPIGMKGSKTGGVKVVGLSNRG